MNILYCRQEKQACKDELVDTLLPQRCRILGGVARLDYASFHSQMTTAADQGTVNRTGPSTRQRKLIWFYWYLIFVPVTRFSDCAISFRKLSNNWSGTPCADDTRNLLLSHDVIWQLTMHRSLIWLQFVWIHCRKQSIPNHLKLKKYPHFYLTIFCPWLSYCNTHWCGG